MRREDLFHAIGMVEDDLLIRCETFRNPSVTVQRKDSKMNNGKYEPTGKPRSLRRAWLIAAIILLMTLLMGSAIVKLVSMRTEKIKLDVYKEQTQQEAQKDSGDPGQIPGETIGVTETHEGEIVVFDEIQDVFLELKPYYPQEVPAGYTMTFVSEGAPLQNQSIVYTNEAGKEIRYWIYIGDPASSIEIYDIVSKNEVEINGGKGFLYAQKGNGRTLVWTDEKEGFGFALATADTDVDILAMAESTAEGAYLTPTRSESTVKAVQELGDFIPEYLPDGFVEQGTMGAPVDEGGGWYSYVRKWFVNREENMQIYFEYESYRIVTEDGYEDNAQTICSFWMPKDHNRQVEGEEVEINGMFGYAGENDVVWADAENHIVFHLYSKEITGDDLLSVALGINKAE